MESTNIRYINSIEEMSLNAWPSHKMELYDGWLLRFSHNYTHRTNSVHQVGESHIPLDEKIAYCEEVYHHLHSPTIFKISPLIDSSFDHLLKERGYKKEHITENMVMDYHDFKPLRPIHVEKEYYGRNSGLPSIVGYENGNVIHLKDRVTDDWVKGVLMLNGTTNPTLQRIVPSMYQAILKEVIVASVWDDGEMIGSGLGILDRDHVGIYAIYVNQEYRRKGIARAIVSTILTEAEKKGCKHAYLQCVKGNTPAKSLYESIGFKYLYEYWFRVK
ncbi:Acetyltransferase (GNAT) family protein [Kandleria vitulina]|jgi:ribosomal protein S18 acetylase RimI-like enzyme|nr:GNAT family N-acetyltransferase [Kandleria vitulina]SDL66949.1 Acetyltransferase (GNAT) family protein [Kandleria vitulina]SEI66749.1 Acetyltransferase (GNAT) family protein [Kandleria vitulina]